MQEKSKAQVKPTDFEQTVEAIRARLKPVREANYSYKKEK